jgi:hypothetical protein
LHHRPPITPGAISLISPCTSAPHPQPAPADRIPVAFWLALVFLFSLLLLHLNGRSMANGETIPYRYVPTALLRDGTFRLDAFPHLDQPSIYAVVRDKEGHLISKKTALPALFEAPFFFGFRVLRGYWPEDEADSIFLGKLTMSLLAALAATFLSAALLPLVRRRWIALCAGPGLIALTPFWFPANGAWVHPLLGALNAAALWLLTTRAGTPATRARTWFWIGLTQGLAIATRIGNIPTALVFLLAALFVPAAQSTLKPRLRRLGAFLLGALPALLFLGIYNYTYFGHPLRTAFGSKPVSMIRLPFEGLAGLLVSPGEGLLLFSPILLLALLALRRPVRSLFAIRVAFFAGLVHLLYWASYLDWWGGSAWGPRYLAEVIPFGLFIAALSLDATLAQWQPVRRRALAAAAATLCLASFAIQFIGMFTWDNTYHQRFDPGFWTNDGDHWAWKAPYEPAWSASHLYWQRPDWLQWFTPVPESDQPHMEADSDSNQPS